MLASARFCHCNNTMRLYTSHIACCRLLLHGSEPLVSCRSPEATQYNASPLRESADVWSLGCTILYMFTQQFPFEGKNSAQIGTALQAGHTPDIPNTLPSDLRRMLRQCFAFRQNRRPTAAQVVAKLQVNQFSQHCCLSPCLVSHCPCVHYCC